MINSGFKIMTAVILGIMIAFAATSVLVVIYFILGMFTGIYGMCVTAPDWWQEIYSNLLYTIPGLSVIAGISIAIKIYKDSQESLK
jgi:hypothetical protein